jgi:anthranilate phosphoribosyltransferase
MPAPRELLQQLLERRDLAQAQAEELLAHLTDGELAPAMAGAILAALTTKGVVADEVRGFALAMRRLARRPNLPPELRAIDIVGTGGDASGSFNISTGTALLTAACGVPVVKHGNRSVSSRSGSADVLAALGVSIPADGAAAADCLSATGFTYLFAPHYHPATARVAPIRAALGVRTVFNILGPLVNPAQPPLHLIGAYSLSVAQLMAETLAAPHRARLRRARSGRMGRADPGRPVHAVRRASREGRGRSSQPRGLRPCRLSERRARRRRCSAQRPCARGGARGR